MPQGHAPGAYPTGMWELSLYLEFCEFVHNVRKPGKALLGALIALLVS